MNNAMGSQIMGQNDVHLFLKLYKWDKSNQLFILYWSCHNGIMASTNLKLV